jgi:hypothetical protein
MCTNGASFQRFARVPHCTKAYVFGTTVRTNSSNSLHSKRRQDFKMRRKFPAQMGRRYYKYILQKWDGTPLDYTDVAQDSDRWRSCVNTVINFGFHKTERGGGES